MNYRSRFPTVQPSFRQRPGSEPGWLARDGAGHGVVRAAQGSYKKHKQLLTARQYCSSPTCQLMTPRSERSNQLRCPAARPKQALALVVWRSCAGRRTSCEGTTKACSRADHVWALSDDCLSTSEDCRGGSTASGGHYQGWGGGLGSQGRPARGHQWWRRLPSEAHEASNAASSPRRTMRVTGECPTPRLGASRRLGASGSGDGWADLARASGAFVD